MPDKYPKKITVEWINNELQKGNFPNIYPDKAFLKEHYDIVDPYRTEIKLYKVNCYKELNTYFKTGEVIMQGCPAAKLNEMAEKAGKAGLSAKEKVELVAHRLEELYDKVKPLPYDVIVYRGVKRGTIGQNLFTGACIKTRLYDLDMHRFCEDPDLEDIKLYGESKGGDPRPYVAETLGFVSTTSNIGIALRFASKGFEYDTIIALRLPAGTKFIMPVDSSGIDDEYEYILFPQHSTFVINNMIDTTVSYLVTKKIPIYVGAYCNELNEFRPKTGPKLRKLKVKILDSSEWWNKQMKDRPLLTVKTSACTSNCEEFLHFCDPETGKCLGDKPKTLTTIQNWWKEKNLKGKCDKKAIKKCVDKFEACDPNTGDCITTQNTGVWGYSATITDRVLNWIAPEEIIAKQKPRYNCDADKIKKCAQQNKLCNPQAYLPNCTKYSEKGLWYVNNVIPKSELKNMVPTGKCTEQGSKYCLHLLGNQFCNPDTGMCVEISDQNEVAWKKMLAAQTKKAKKEYAEKKAEKKAKKEAEEKAKAEKIIAQQKPRYKCTKKKIEQCAQQGKLCHPVYYQGEDCKDVDDFDEDLYYVNHVVDKTDLKDLEPYGKCSPFHISYCANKKKFCDPKTAICLKFNTTNKKQVSSLHKELKKQQKKKKPFMTAYLSMKVTELKADLKKRGLPVSGNKSALIARLAADDVKK
uniref:SAP domain protein n=2 Tax=root TaxID=1 RepID=A0A481YXW8_9VIRU|nr:MAG: SAP domain protein [Marseillevirus LCMAC202]